MTEPVMDKRTAERASMGEKIGGGFFVFMRHPNGRVMISPTGIPFEHSTLERAEAEAERLAKHLPGHRFCVFAEVASAIAKLADPSPEAEEAGAAVSQDASLTAQGETAALNSEAASS